MGKIGTKRTKSFLRAKGPHNPKPKKKQVNSSTYVESKFSLNQEKKDLPKNPEAGIRKLSPAVQTKMGYNSMSQKRMGLHQQKEERRFAQDRSDSTAMFMGGKGPGQFNNPSWKAAADSAKKANPNIDADKIKSSDIYKPTKWFLNILYYLVVLLEDSMIMAQYHIILKIILYLLIILKAYMAPV